MSGQIKLRHQAAIVVALLGVMEDGSIGEIGILPGRSGFLPARKHVLEQKRVVGQNQLLALNGEKEGHRTIEGQILLRRD